MKIVTFLSDFGDKDWFVAAVKGEILKIAGDVQIIDICHRTRVFDVRSAAFMLAAVSGNFPAGTVHLAVVDPGVGSRRKPLIVRSQGYYFVGPDNGLFSFVLGHGAKIYTIKSLRDISRTFHGRDLFGPVAAMLAKGVKPEKLGTCVKSCKQFKFPEPEKNRNLIMGEIVYVDDFGNLVTNILNTYNCKELVVRCIGIEVKQSYGAVEKNELVAVRGSCGYYEIACNRGSAKRRLKAFIGLPVRSKFPANS